MVAIIVAAITLAVPVRAEQDPAEVIKALVNPALQILADNATPLKDRRQKLRDLVNSNFDFIAMSRSALGRHWKDCQRSAAQRFHAGRTLRQSVSQSLNAASENSNARLS